MNKEKIMLETLRQAKEALAIGNGPFGAVIALGDEVIVSTRNRTSESHDPTAHAEVAAIREACQKLKTNNLSGYTLYTSCHPCPMCLSASKWAKISEIIYCLSNEDTSQIGYDDTAHYQDVSRQQGERSIPFVQLMNDQGMKLLIKNQKKG